MKRIKKILSLFFLVFLTFIFIFPNAQALSNRTDAVSTNNHTSLTIGSLSFSNITFQNGSSSSSFGLTADVINTSSNDIQYKATIYYYDINYNIMTMESFNNTASQGQSKFNSTSSFSVFENNTVQDIKYYRLEVNIINKQTTNSSLNTQNNTHNQSNNYNSYDYVIDNYDVNIIVNENNTFDITETITVTYNKPNTKFIIKIPSNYKLKKDDGNFIYKRIKVSNLRISSPYSNGISSYGNDKYTTHTITNINPNETKVYQIDYTYNIGKDNFKNKDKIYLSINQGKWQDINNLTFNIQMPKDFEQNKIKFELGNKSLKKTEITYQVNNNNNISGNLNIKLPKEKDLVFTCDLKEGYFKNANSLIENKDYVLYIVPFICLIIALIIWFFFTDRKTFITKKTFYPPKDVNNLEASFIYNGSATMADVILLLLYLANQGYIKIAEKKEKSILIKQTDYRIIKTKQYDGNNIYERLFLEELFKHNPKEITITSIYNRLDEIISKILQKINNEENNRKRNKKNNLNLLKIRKILIIITYFVITLIPLLNIDPILVIIIVSFQILSIKIIKKTFYTKTVKILKLITSLGILFVFNVFSFILFIPIVLADKIYFLGYILGLIYIITMLVLSKSKSKKTIFENNVVINLQELKNFIKKPNRKELETLVRQNQNYFYIILPYAYCLGLSQKWKEEFQNIPINNPTWYIGEENFTTEYLEKIIKQFSLKNIIANKKGWL